ncbi:MAG TPA: hypothetical protein VHK28_02400 [Candidatus Limnocylindria bacterium]|nr:hypothetical protein [Candidatus Limnocylindria bacterium]
MGESAVGFLILGVGILAILALVFAVTLRSGRAAAGRPEPPRGVHLPPPSYLPVVMSVGAALIGAGLSFRPEEPMTMPVMDVVSGLMHPLIGPLGVIVLLYGVWAWVRAAGHEWRETERGAHGHEDARGH